MTDAYCRRCGRPRGCDQPAPSRRPAPGGDTPCDPVKAALLLPAIALSLLGFAAEQASRPSRRQLDGPPNFSRWKVGR